MTLDHSALILEGGGFRGVYTSGVLRLFMDRGLYLPYVIGVSMGACNAANYVSRQPERNRIVNIRYVNDSRYMSYLRLFTKGELFGMTFIFDALPYRLAPFDHTTFTASDQKCIFCVTDCETGEALYFEKNELGEDYLKALQASVSLPFVTKPVPFRGRILMDGGISDSVPIRKSLEDGNTRNILVLTRPKGYRKKPSRFITLARIMYPKYKGLSRAIARRHTRYNTTMDFIDRLEAHGDVFVIRPQSDLGVGRIARNKARLYAVYEQGYGDASKSYPALCTYLDSLPSSPA